MSDQVTSDAKGRVIPGYYVERGTGERVRVGCTVNGIVHARVWAEPNIRLQIDCKTFIENFDREHK